MLCVFVSMSHHSEFQSFVIVNCECLCEICFLCCFHSIRLLLYLLLHFNHLISNPKSKKNIERKQINEQIKCIHDPSVFQRQLYWRDCQQDKQVHKNKPFDFLLLNCSLFSQFVKIFHMDKLANDKHINNKPIKK